MLRLGLFLAHVMCMRRMEVEMKAGRRSLVTASVLLLTVSWSALSYGASPIRDLFEDAFYGGLAGTLVGGALLAFTKKPSDHLDYLAYGGATGVLFGATYGAVKTTQALAEYDKGRLRFSMPTVLPDFQEASSRGQATIGFKATLLRGQF
jgi:hypothetical protein